MLDRSFESYKARLLKNSKMLAFANFIGMYRWSETIYEYAVGSLRLVHPVSWLVIIGMFFMGVYIQGVPDTVKDLKSSIKDDTVWY